MWNLERKGHKGKRGAIRDQGEEREIRKCIEG
jgi:hypothetical protein